MNKMIFKLKKRMQKRNQYEIDYNQRIIEKDNELEGKIKKQIQEFLIKDKMPLFNNIEIETINWCNGTCSFCPVNKYIDPRKHSVMEKELFQKIIRELKDINYKDAIALHSNNEPLLDKRLVELAKYVKEELPESFLYIFTNGTLMTLKKFKNLIKYLDLIVIDNYNDDLKLITPVKEIYDYCKKNPELKEKVLIEKRLQNQILTSRGGQSKNRNDIIKLKSSCLLPFNKIVIQSNGIVPLCCCDPFAKVVLGDLNKNTLVEIWEGKKHTSIIKKLSKNNPRKRINLCKNCDVLTDKMYSIPYTKEDILRYWNLIENE